MNTLAMPYLKIPHLMRVRWMRSLTLPLTIIYLINLTWLSWGYSDNLGSNPQPFQVVILLGVPAYIALLSIRRTWFKP